MLDLHPEQLLLDSLPLHVLNDLEVVAQVTAAEIQNLKFLVVNLVGSLHFGYQLMRIEVSLDGVVFRVRLLLAEGEKHRIHEELFGFSLDTHLLP
jgi:hypothetical protein